jgi:hypothetical protein
MKPALLQIYQDTLNSCRARLLKNLLSLFVTLFLFAAACPAQENPGAIFAASDGKGHISLLWFPPASKWPGGGWRLLDSSGKVIASTAMGEAGALQKLPLEDADAIRKLMAVLSRSDANPKQRMQLIGILGMRAFSEPDYARALGLSWTVENAGAGSRIYKVQGLDSAGKPTGVELASPAVDGAKPTALSPAPDRLHANVSEAGVALSWAPPAENRQLPVIAYAVERDGAPVTAKPVVVGARWKPEQTLVVDRAAPPEETVTYRIYGVDVFGRRSQPGSISVFYPDFHALAPPDPIQAEPSSAKVVVTWKAQSNSEAKPNLAGYMVERALLQSGPYEALTPEALPPSTARYEDSNLRGGTVYYYRVRAVSPRGDLGPPSHSAMAQPTNPGKPPKVAGLAADAGQTRVRLTWQPVSFPVAGYFVERRSVPASAAAATSDASNATNWVRLNPHVTPEPLYDDYFGQTSDAKFEYRIVAIAFDNGEGPPSDATQATLPNLSLPESPTITAASGAEGKVQLSFSPALPEERTTQFLVLRGGSPDDIGVVIGDPLPGSARQFQDLYVAAGESYWYRLVALDKAGNRSDPTAAVAVRVGSPTIPKPETPAVQFASKPYPKVTLQFGKAPAGLAVVLERQAQAGSGWIRIAGPAQDQTTLSDNAPPETRPLWYRLSYVSADGKVGPASDAVTVTMK